MYIVSNSGMQRVLLLILILFTFSCADDETESFTYTPEVKSFVSDREIITGQIIQLKLRAIGNIIIFPKIEKIDGVKVLEQSERITNKFHYINGVLKKERTVKILTLAPYHDITIPSYEVEIDGRMYQTKPIKIKVTKANAQNKEDNNKYLLHLRADKKSVIIGEPILVSAYFSLKFGVRLSKNPQYTKPAFKGFFVKEVAEKKVYNEDQRQVTEYTYLLTPLYEGNFTVGPATAKLRVIHKNRRNMFGRSTGASLISIASNSIDIEVKEKLQKSDLVGSFILEHTLYKQSVKANKPVNLDINISGVGSLEDFEFTEYEIDGVTVYNDEASITTALRDNSVHSSYSKSFVFISDHDFTIPARHISVYNTQSKTVKFLEVPSYDIHVKGSQTIALQKFHVNTSTADQVQINLNISKKSMLDIEELSASWWMIVLAFVLGLLAMSLLMLLPKRIRGQKYYSCSCKESEALKILYPHIAESSKIEAMVRKLYAKKNADKSIVIDKKVLRELVEKVKKPH